MSAARAILVIEDTPANLELAADLLGAAGYDVRLAATAEAGIVSARSSPPDLVLMDIRLPGMDGIAAMKVLKADPKTGRVPVIALTAQAMKGDDTGALEAGFDGYIPKPINTRTFARTVAEFLARAPA